MGFLDFFHRNIKFFSCCFLLLAGTVSGDDKRIYLAGKGESDQAVIYSLPLDTQSLENGTVSWERTEIDLPGLVLHPHFTTFHRPLSEKRHLFAGHNGYLYLASWIKEISQYQVRRMTLNLRTLGFQPKSSQWWSMPQSLRARNLHSPVYISEEIEIDNRKTVFLLIDNRAFTLDIEALASEESDTGIQPFPGAGSNQVIPDSESDYHPTGLSLLSDTHDGQTRVRVVAAMDKYYRDKKTDHKRKVRMFYSDLTGNDQSWRVLPVAERTQGLGIHFKRNEQGLWSATRFNSGDIKSLCADSTTRELLFRGHHNSLMVINDPYSLNSEPAPDDSGKNLYRLQGTGDVPHTDLMTCFDGNIYLAAATSDDAADLSKGTVTQQRSKWLMVAKRPERLSLSSTGGDYVNPVETGWKHLLLIPDFNDGNENWAWSINILQPQPVKVEEALSQPAAKTEL